jgi:hypothetical protein
MLVSHSTIIISPLSLLSAFSSLLSALILTHRLITSSLGHQSYSVTLGDESFHRIGHQGRGLDVEDQGWKDILLETTPDR